MCVWGGHHVVLNFVKNLPQLCVVRPPHAFHTSHHCVSTCVPMTTRTPLPAGNHWSRRPLMRLRRPALHAPPAAP